MQKPNKNPIGMAVSTHKPDMALMIKMATSNMKIKKIVNDTLTVFCDDIKTSILDIYGDSFLFRFMTIYQLKAHISSRVECRAAFLPVPLSQHHLSASGACFPAGWRHKDYFRHLSDGS